LRGEFRAERRAQGGTVVEWEVPLDGSAPVD
jgi:hypothetical protein